MLSYDANGNLTADGALSYTYTPENRLASGASEPKLVYDGLGNLLSSQSDMTVYRTIGGEIATEHDAATGTIRNRYDEASHDRGQV